VNYKTYFVAAL